MHPSELLSRTLLFRGLGEAGLQQAAQRLVRGDYPFDTEIASEGEPGEGVYIVEHGSVGMFVRDAEGGPPRLVGELGPCETFGETEIVTGRTRQVTYTALDDCIVYRLDRDDFNGLAASNPGLVSATARALAERLRSKLQPEGFPMVTLAGRRFDRKIWALAPESLLVQHRMALLELRGHVLTIGMVDPHDVAARSALSRALPGFAFRIVAVSPGELQRFVEQGIGKKQLVQGQNEARPAISFVDDEEAARAQAPKVSGQQVVQLVEEIVSVGLGTGASDIHIENERKGVMVRYRVDGALRPRGSLLPGELHKPLVSRFKLLGKLDITETRRPADGRISVRVGKRLVDLRMSTVPAKLGEKVVLRILDAEGAINDLKSVFFVDTLRQRFGEMLFKPHGLILITGPTGSGKTTTLYSAISARLKPELNVCTVEDPVEYHLDGVTQIQVHPEIGTTFATVLRALLRQDPDIILVGETRDRETAKIATEASMTGHMVLTSVHTNGAIEAVLRLEDLGVERYAIANALLGVVHQRLVRRLCSECVEPFEYPPPIVERLKSAGALPARLSSPLLRGKGCQRCGGSGFKGRVALFELLTINDAVRMAISGGESGLGLRQAATSSGSLFEIARYAGALLTRGLTTPDEVLHLVLRDVELGEKARAASSVPPAAPQVLDVAMPRESPVPLAAAQRPAAPKTSRRTPPFADAPSAAGPEHPTVPAAPPSHAARARSSPSGRYSKSQSSDGGPPYSPTLPSQQAARPSSEPKIASGQKEQPRPRASSFHPGTMHGQGTSLELDTDDDALELDIDRLKK